MSATSTTSTKSIEAITFAVWSPQEIRKYSVVEITQPETYDEVFDNIQHR